LLFSFISFVAVSRHLVEVVVEVVVVVAAIVVLEVEVVIRERLAPLAGQVRDGEALRVAEDLKERRPFTLEAEVEIVADGEELVEDRHLVGLILDLANLEILSGKKAPVEETDRANWMNLQVSFNQKFHIFFLSIPFSLFLVEKFDYSCPCCRCSRLLIFVLSAKF
jgi:hypothetical protein